VASSNPYRFPSCTAGCIFFLFTKFIDVNEIIMHSHKRLKRCTKNIDEIDTWQKGVSPRFQFFAGLFGIIKIVLCSKLQRQISQDGRTNVTNSCQFSASWHRYALYSLFLIYRCASALLLFSFISSSALVDCVCGVYSFWQTRVTILGSNFLADHRL